MQGGFPANGLAAFDPEAADKLARALRGEVASASAAAAAPSPKPQPRALELAAFGVSDELDLPARRLRGSLVRLCRRLRGTGFTLEALEVELGAWILSAGEPTGATVQVSEGSLVGPALRNRRRTGGPVHHPAGG